MNLLEVLGKRPIGCTGRIALELVVVTYRDLAACSALRPDLKVYYYWCGDWRSVKFPLGLHSMPVFNDFVLYTLTAYRKTEPGRWSRIASSHDRDTLGSPNTRRVTIVDILPITKQCCKSRGTGNTDPAYQLVLRSKSIHSSSSAGTVHHDA